MFRRGVVRVVLVGMFVAACHPGLVLGATPEINRVAEIDAKCWFNAQPVRLLDPPKLILLEFWSTSSRESLELLDVVRRLHEGLGDKGVFVIALTGDSCEDVRRFIHHKKVEYKIGGESRADKRYKIEQLPTIVLVDLEERRIVGRWSGREITIRAIDRAIREFLGNGDGGQPGGLSIESFASLQESIDGAFQMLDTLTDEILAGDKLISPDDLWPLDRFYEANLPDGSARDDPGARALGAARAGVLGSGRNTGYGKLLASGRLTDAAEDAIRDRVLDVARSDPSPSVRSSAIHTLRLSGRPGDPVLLEALRNLRDSLDTADEQPANPLLRASIDHALGELDPATRELKVAEHRAGPIALRARQQLNESPDPSTSPWAEAHAYFETVSIRTTDELLGDYGSFGDSSDDDIATQNARLKRSEAMRAIAHRIVAGEIKNPSAVKEHLARALSDEPDEWIRRTVVDALRGIARRGDRGVRAEIAQVFEKRLSEEPDGYVRARIEIYLKELEGG